MKIPTWLFSYSKRLQFYVDIIELIIPNVQKERFFYFKNHRCVLHFNPEKRLYAFNSFMITSIFQIVPLKKAVAKIRNYFICPSFIVNSFKPTFLWETANGFWAYSR